MDGEISWIRRRRRRADGGRRFVLRQLADEQEEAVQRGADQVAGVDVRDADEAGAAQKLQLARSSACSPGRSPYGSRTSGALESKQLEREYSALRSDYDLLLASFDSLKKEKHMLLKQLQKLNGLLDKPQEEEANATVIRRTQISTRGRSELYTVQQQACSTLTSEVEDQFGFQTSWPSDQSCTSTQWWEFWPMNE
uniref:Homeobox-leucine zipper protein n=1 Tax=Ananas comosus var. bracteatus TaxID=296719 RepID=A0A6V7NSA9_ANACO|nr:unnamed protein product [Ananas comosus var. bracteatus]